jgi:hypothetical protein
VNTGSDNVDMVRLWMDKIGFQIIRMRSDLLASNHEIGLDQLTTEVKGCLVRIRAITTRNARQPSGPHAAYAARGCSSQAGPPPAGTKAQK